MGGIYIYIYRYIFLQYILMILLQHDINFASPMFYEYSLLFGSLFKYNYLPRERDINGKKKKIKA